MGYTTGSCCGDKVSHGALPTRVAERIRRGEERGSLDEAGMQAAMSPKEERREGEGEKGGVRYGDESVGVESRLDVEKRRTA